MPNLSGKSFFDFDPPAFGLDVSDETVKLAMLAKSGRHFKLESFGKKRIPSGVIEHGEIKNPVKLQAVIKSLLEKVKGASLSTSYAVCSLPEEKSFVRVIQLPKAKKEEVEGAVTYEAENNIPLGIDEVYLDWQVIPPRFKHLEHMDVLIVATPKTIIDSYMEVFKKAGITPKVLEVESNAIIRSVIPNGFAEEPTFIIDLGPTVTTFILFSGNTLHLSSTLEISGQSFTELIAREFKLKIEDAENLKQRVGLDRKKEGGKVVECLIPALTDLVDQIKSHISFYNEHTEHEHVKPGTKPTGVRKALLCGGGANLKGLDAYLALELQMAVERANPWVNILKPPLREVPGISYSGSLSYTTALGLALRGAKKF